MVNFLPARIPGRVRGAGPSACFGLPLEKMPHIDKVIVLPPEFCRQQPESAARKSLPPTNGVLLD